MRGNETCETLFLFYTRIKNDKLIFSRAKMRKLFLAFHTWENKFSACLFTKQNLFRLILLFRACFGHRPLDHSRARPLHKTCETKQNKHRINAAREASKNTAPEKSRQTNKMIISKTSKTKNNARIRASVQFFLFVQWLVFVHWLLEVARRPSSPVAFLPRPRPPGRCSKGRPLPIPIVV